MACMPKISVPLTNDARSYRRNAVMRQRFCAFKSLWPISDLQSMVHAQIAVYCDSGGFVVR